MNPKITDQLKQGLIIISLGAMAAMIPFYFNTSAMTQQNQQTNIEQSLTIENTKARLHDLEVKGAIDDTEINQIKLSLDRIEKKIDRLIEKQTK